MASQEQERRVARLNGWRRNALSQISDAKQELDAITADITEHGHALRSLPDIQRLAHRLAQIDTLEQVIQEIEAETILPPD